VLSRTYLLLTAAIVAEVVATTALAGSAGMTRLWPTLAALGGYAFAFWLLSLTLQAMPTGVVYAIWSGLGIVLVTAWVWSKQALDLPAILGMGLIVAGVFVVNVFSKTVSH